MFIVIVCRNLRATMTNAVSAQRHLPLALYAKITQSATLLVAALAELTLTRFCGVREESDGIRPTKREVNHATATANLHTGVQAKGSATPGNQRQKRHRDRGISDTMLYRWRKEMRANGPTAFPGKGQQTEREEEVRRLRRENDLLRQERDILKKAAAIFWQNPQ